MQSESGHRTPALTSIPTHHGFAGATATRPEEVSACTSAEEANAEQVGHRCSILGGLIVFVWISNASDGDSSDGSNAPNRGSSDVDWEDYAPEVRTRIADLAANNDAQLARVRDNNADLMRYIDDKMRNAGCYG
jgi:hypothetical protein